jgi:hypothetical protein
MRRFIQRLQPLKCRRCEDDSSANLVRAVRLEHAFEYRVLERQPFDRAAGPGQHVAKHAAIARDDRQARTRPRQTETREDAAEETVAFGVQQRDLRDRERHAAALASKDVVHAGRRERLDEA